MDNTETNAQTRPEPEPEPLTLEFGPPQRYLVFLWTVLAWVQAGLVFLWNIPWYRREITDVRSWVIWALFDAILLIGSTHATLFRVRVDQAGMEFLKWNFRWVRWDWEEIYRLESRSSYIGSRYRVRSERGAFGFASLAVTGAARLAATIIERADLDDYGEESVSLQSGTLHVWLHPSAADDR
jgi:hypothetical protein